MNTSFFPSTRNTLTVETMGPEWLVDNNTYNKAFPFPKGAEVYVKEAGRGKQMIPIWLDHANQRFTLTKAGRPMRNAVWDVTPTGILKKVAATGAISFNTAFGNWRSLWITMDGGKNFVTGYELRRLHTAQFGLQRIRNDRWDHPSM